MNNSLFQQPQMGPQGMSMNPQMTLGQPPRLNQPMMPPEGQPMRPPMGQPTGGPPGLPPGIPYPEQASNQFSVGNPLIDKYILSFIG